MCAGFRRAGVVLGRGGALLGQPFLRNAFLAGTAIAAACGLVGYFLVLRSQVFTGDALSHVAFAGALAALSFGVDPRLGLFVSTIAVGILMGTLGPRGQADDVVVGSVFAWILGLGVLFLTIYTTSKSTADSTAGVSVLFGSIFGLSHEPGRRGHGDRRRSWSAPWCSSPDRSMFASIDPGVASARRVPVVVLGLGFLALVGACAAEATQAVGALLLLGLLAAPAGTAQRLTRPALSGHWRCRVLWRSRRCGRGSS